MRDKSVEQLLWVCVGYSMYIQMEYLISFHNPAHTMFQHPSDPSCQLNSTQLVSDWLTYQIVFVASSVKLLASVIWKEPRNGQSKAYGVTRILMEQKDILFLCLINNISYAMTQIDGVGKEVGVCCFSDRKFMQVLEPSNLGESFNYLQDYLTLNPSTY